MEERDITAKLQAYAKFLDDKIKEQEDAEAFADRTLVRGYDHDAYEAWKKADTAKTAYVFAQSEIYTLFPDLKPAETAQKP